MPPTPPDGGTSTSPGGMEPPFKPKPGQTMERDGSDWILRGLDGREIMRYTPEETQEIVNTILNE